MCFVPDEHPSASCREPWSHQPSLTYSQGALHKQPGSWWGGLSGALELKENNQTVLWKWDRWRYLDCLFGDVYLWRKGFSYGDWSSCSALDWRLIGRHRTVFQKDCLRRGQRMEAINDVETDHWHQALAWKHPTVLPVKGTIQLCPHWLERRRRRCSFDRGHQKVHKVQGSRNAGKRSSRNHDCERQVTRCERSCAW